MRTILMTLLTLCLLNLPAFKAQAAPPGQDGILSAATFVGLETIRLWPGRAPGAVGDAPEDIPTLTVFRPSSEYDNGSAVLIAPGGGYRGLAAGKEGREVADWFTARGFTAFILKYRLLPRYQMPIPLVDAQRAIRWIRANSKRLRISPQRVGMIGFSAGGNLAALTGTRFHPVDTQASDPVDQQNDRPDFIVLAYPVITSYATMDIDRCKSLRHLKPCTREYLQTFNPIPHITPQTPPTFVYHTSEDKSVPVDDSIAFYNAAHKAGVATELHIFAHGAHGAHGLGLGGGDLALGAWPTLMENWLRQQGLLEPDPAIFPGADIPVSKNTGFSIDTPLEHFVSNQTARGILEKSFGSDRTNTLLGKLGHLSLREVAARRSWWGIDDDKIHRLSRELKNIQ